MGFETKRFIRMVNWCQDCRLFSVKFILAPYQKSNTYKIRGADVIGVGISWNSVPGGLKPKMEFTFSSYTDIDTDEATWIEWDGDGEINKAITGFRAENTNPTYNFIIVVTIKAGY